MTRQKLKVGDRVRIWKSARIWTVLQVDVPGEYPPAPSTYLVRIGRPDPGNGEELVYGDRGLNLVEH